MNQQELYDRLGIELIRQLTQAENVEELAQMLEEHRMALSTEELQVLFDALAPLAANRRLTTQICLR